MTLQSEDVDRADLLVACARRPGQERRKEGFAKKGEGGWGWGGVGGGGGEGRGGFEAHSLSTASVCSSSKRLGGVPQGGGRRSDPGLLVPDA